jgi:hypothetical protein
MVTIWRERGLRFVIFVDDHEPAHVHVFGDGEMKVDLTQDDPTKTLLWAEGMKRADIRRAMRIVGDNREAFLARWKEIHG